MHPPAPPPALRDSCAGAPASAFASGRSGVRPAPVSIDGVFPLNKARGETSAKSAAAVRKLLGAKKAGHGGALDPLADGLVVVLLGAATSLARFALAGNKTYRARVRFGFATTTDDAEGEPLSAAQKPDLSGLPEFLPEFVGEFQQDAPKHSALKHQGRPLYYYARRGLEAPVKRRTARVYSLELLGVEGDCAELEIRCASGFYVRSLARDLGEKTGCGAHLSALTRSESGGLKLENAVSLSRLREMTSEERAGTILPSEVAVSHLPEVILRLSRAADLANGVAVDIPAGVSSDGECCLRAEDGRFAGAGVISEGMLRPLAMMPWTRGGKNEKGGRDAKKHGARGRRGGRGGIRRTMAHGKLRAKGA